MSFSSLMHFGGKNHLSVIMSDPMNKTLWIGVKNVYESCLKNEHISIFLFHKVKPLPSETTCFFIQNHFVPWCIISPCAPTTKEKHETNRSPNSGLPTCGATRNANDKGLHMALLAFTLPQRKIFTQLLLGWLLKARTSGFVAFATFLKHRYLQCFMLPRPIFTAAHSIS